MAELILERAALVNWLRDMRPDAIAGVARHAGDCPIARRLRALGARWINVGTCFLMIDGYQIPTSAWAAAFIRDVDDAAVTGMTQITARACLRILGESATEDFAGRAVQTERELVTA